MKTTTKRENGSKPSCSCNQPTIEMLRAVTPIKDGMLKEVKCKKCGKSFLTNFDTEYCFDYGRNLEIKTNG
ncbi:hypothetical protein HXY33_06050 [Candidatus Bathyarchaeota archaeon]|nr:hypothetical protein [Candidatus Bathyarchaeota archaeon]